MADTVDLIGGPRAHRVVRVFLVAPDGGRKEIYTSPRLVTTPLARKKKCGRLTTPAFTHTTALTPGETAAICGSTGKASAETMRELMNDDSSFEITISEGFSRVPDIHPHSAVLTVGWLCGTDVRID